MYKQGDIVIVNFPFTDLSNSKVRPAVIISNDKINISGDYLIVMISTQEIKGDFSVNISNIDVTTFVTRYTFFSLKLIEPFALCKAKAKDLFCNN